MEKKVDRRIIKSKKAIREAFLELLNEHELKDITIKDISERAQIDRKTFYNYYPSIFILLNEFENELVNNLDALFDEIDFSKFVENPEEIFEALCRFVKPNLYYYKMMFNITFSENLSKKVIGLLKLKINYSLEKFIISINRDPSQYDVELISEYLASSILGVYFSWIQDGCVLPIETITKDVGRIAIYGIYGSLVEIPNYDKAGE